MNKRTPKRDAAAMIVAKNWRIRRRFKQITRYAVLHGYIKVNPWW